MFTHLRQARKCSYLTTVKRISRPNFLFSTSNVSCRLLDTSASPPLTLDVNCHGLPLARKYSTAATARENDLPEDTSRLPKFAQLQLDFFGEPVTFLNSTQVSNEGTTNAMAALDGFLLAVVSKGKTCIGGGGEAGLEIKSAHAAALSWSELLRHAAVWNQTPGPKDDRPIAPMLAVVSVAPVLAQAGSSYVKHLDTLLKHAKLGAPGLSVIQMYELAVEATAHKQNDKLNVRERMHLQALDYLLRDDHPSALAKMLGILRICPGDAFALSQAMDLSQTVGDKDAALRAAGSVASYWNERRGGFVRPAIPGHSMASSLVALGMAVGGRHEEAEQMAERAMKRGKNVAGGLATWAQAHVFDSNGRVSEGISALANFDGISNYEGSGLLFFESRLGGYGARFSLDREERGRGKSQALRLYSTHFDRILEYSGFSEGQPWDRPLERAPLSWSSKLMLGSGDERSVLSSITRFFGKPPKSGQTEFEVMNREESLPSLQVDNWEPSCEDVLTWIPPTPQVLSDATLLLFRFTLNGTVSRKNPRWDYVRKAWQTMLDIQRRHNGSLHFAPLACMAASLLFPPSETGGDMIGNGRLAKGLWMMGEKLQFGELSVEQSSEEISTAVREKVAEREPDFWLPANKESDDDWRKIVDHLASAIDGYNDPEESDDSATVTVNPSARFQAWDFEARPILEHAIVYAACKSGDIERLSLARAICSQGVTLRPSSPEEWWRYSIVLGLLGDQVASEDALNTSINVGAGQGARAS